MSFRIFRRLAIPSMCLLAWGVLAAPSPAAWPGGNGAIAFSYNARAGRAGGDIRIKKPSGSERSLTSARSANDGEPTYSPDGRQIAFTRYSGSDFDIWLMNSDGSDKRAVTMTDDRTSEVEPDFLPSGRALVFAQLGGSGAGDVYSIGTDGRRRQLQARNARSPLVSPNGRWLAFRRQPGAIGSG